MAASISFLLARMHVSSPTQTPQEICRKRYEKIKNAFFVFLSQMQLQKLEIEKTSLAIEIFNFQLEALKNELLPISPLAYLDLHTKTKTHTVALTTLIGALDLENPLFPDFDQIGSLKKDLENLYFGSDRQTQIYAKNLSSLASNIIASVECYQLFLQFIEDMPVKFLQKAPCFHIPRGTASIFFKSATTALHISCVKTLGEGTYGTVFQLQGLKKDLAFKKFKQEKNAAFKELMYESWFYIIISPHPSIVSIEAITQEGLLFELGQGDLYYRLNRHDYDTSMICHDFLQIASALEHVHLSGFNYKDLKPSNILFFSDGHIKLCDLGFLELICEDTQRKVCPFFAAPEYDLSKIELITPKADVWAFGVCLFQALTMGKYPLLPHLSNDPAYLQHIITLLKSTAVTKELLFKNLDRSTLELLRSKDPQDKLLPIVIDCLNFNPALRPSMKEVQEQLLLCRSC